MVNEQTLKLHYLSADMEEGFPGNLDITVTYTFSDENELIIDYIGKQTRRQLST